VGYYGFPAALAALLSLDRLFQADFEDGSLMCSRFSPLSMESPRPPRFSPTGDDRMPLVVLSPVAGLLSIFPARYGALVTSLLIGTTGAVPAWVRSGQLSPFDQASGLILD